MNPLPRWLATGFILGCVTTAMAMLSLGAAAPEDRASAAARTFHTPRAADRDDDGKLRIIVFGAHPDDAEIRAGGVAAMWAAQGHHVKLVSVTNGDIGHWGMAGGPLAQRRKVEVEKVARHLGIDEVEVFDIHDGEVLPTLENRKKIVTAIRDWRADLVIAHRPNDYHPDHRYTGILVQDAAFLVTVPYFCPDVPYLTANPVFMYGIDQFQRPNPFRADVAVNIDPVIHKKLDAMMLMESQFVEGGCCRPTDIKTDEDHKAAIAAGREGFKGYFSAWAEITRDALIARYGQEAGSKVQYAEAFEICEYGTQPTEEQLARLFPF